MLRTNIQCIMNIRSKQLNDEEAESIQIWVRIVIVIEIQTGGFSMTVSMAVVPLLRWSCKISDEDSWSGKTETLYRRREDCYRYGCSKNSHKETRGKFVIYLSLE